MGERHECNGEAQGHQGQSMANSDHHTIAFSKTGCKTGHGGPREHVQKGKWQQ